MGAVEEFDAARKDVRRRISGGLGLRKRRLRCRARAGRCAAGHGRRRRLIGPSETESDPARRHRQGRVRAEAAAHCPDPGLSAILDDRYGERAFMRHLLEVERDIDCGAVRAGGLFREWGLILRF